MMRVHVFPDHEAMSQAVASRLTALFAERADAVVAVPSGATPERLYALLVAASRRGDVSLGQARFFALDEYMGLGADDPRSFAAFFRQHLFGPAAIPAARGRVLDGLAADPETELAAYTREVEAAGGLDLTLLGLGGNGHIAFNEPAATLSVGAHVTELAPPASAVARRGLTLGVGDLLAAPRVWLMASGAGKAEAVARMRSGRLDPACPASLLQAHPGAEVFLDGAAAGGL